MMAINMESPSTEMTAFTPESQAQKRYYSGDHKKSNDSE